MLCLYNMYLCLLQSCYCMHTMHCLYVDISMFWISLIFYVSVSKCSTDSDGFHYIIDRCLNFATRAITWFEAREFCRKLDADLVTVNSMEAVKTISEQIESGGQFWVGLHRISWQNKDNKGVFNEKV